MLTRLQVTGFKNLVDVDVRFGPFTCIAGPNGVGKSNLFDAIRFLSALADRTFVDAAKSVRDEGGRAGDIRALFHRVGDRLDDRMKFVVDMIVPPKGTDDFGQPAVAKATFLRYTVELGYHPYSDPAGGGLELRHEELTALRSAEVPDALAFPCAEKWRKSAVRLSSRTSPYISTAGDGPERKVKLHQENVQGRTADRPAARLPRTVLSATNALESPTALLARRAMQSWRLLQLEPTALRKPDELLAPTRLGADGSHLPATLYRLAKGGHPTPGNGAGDPAGAYALVAGKLSDLIADVRTIDVVRDDRRELLSLVATDRRGTPLPARALSDGTLRFLALAVLEQDPEATGVICFEEPENGIHPDRIPAMLRLLRDIATDTDYPVGEDNPLRQVIINTHSPLVVGLTVDDDLLGAVAREHLRGGVRSGRVAFQPLAGTWRTAVENFDLRDALALGHLLAFLGQGPGGDVLGLPPPDGNSGRRHRRAVKDRDDVRSLFDGVPAE